MKKIIYIFAFSILGVLVAFLIHAVIEWPVIFLLTRNFDKYNLGFTWAQWFIIHNVGTALLLFAGGLLGVSQGFFWWRIIYIEKRRFGHHSEVIVLDSRQILFDDTIDFIKHHKNKFDIIILLVEGKNLSKEKIQHSLLPKVTKIITTSQSYVTVLDNLLNEYKKIHFFIDRPVVIDQVKAALPEVLAYLIIRPVELRTKQPGFKVDASDYIVENLNFEVTN